MKKKTVSVIMAAMLTIAMVSSVFADESISEVSSANTEIAEDTIQEAEAFVEETVVEVTDETVEEITKEIDIVGETETTVEAVEDTVEEVVEEVVVDEETTAEETEEAIEVTNEDTVEVESEEATVDADIVVSEETSVSDEVVDEIEEMTGSDNEDGVIVPEGTITMGQTVNYDTYQLNKYYKFTLTESGKVTVAAHVDYTYSWTGFGIFTLAGDRIKYYDRNSAGDVRYAVNLLAGDYYLKIGGNNNYGDYNNKGSVVLSFNKAGETVKDSITSPHNSSLSPIKFDGSTMIGFLAANDHQDVFVYTAPSNGKLKFRYITKEMSDVAIEVYDVDGNHIWGTQSNLYPVRYGVGTSDMLITVKKGKNFIYISNGNQNEGGVYSIAGSFSGGTWVKTSKGYMFKRYNGTYAKNSWEVVNGKYYRFDASGYVMYGWLNVGGNYYRTDANGVVQMNKWVKVGNNYYWADAKGVIAINKWFTVNGKYYRAASNGVVQINKWVKVGANYYRADSKGVIQMNKWIYLGGKYYWADAKGVIAMNKWVTINGKQYYFNSKGIMTKSK